VVERFLVVAGAAGPALVASLAGARPAARVEVAGPEAAALALVSATPPAAVLVDLGLSPEQWRSLLAEASRSRSGVPVVGVTAGTDATTMLDAEALGVVAFLAAPVEQDTLAEVLGRLLDRRAEDATGAR